MLPGFRTTRVPASPRVDGDVGPEPAIGTMDWATPGERESVAAWLGILARGMEAAGDGPADGRFHAEPATKIAAGQRIGGFPDVGAGALEHDMTASLAIARRVKGLLSEM